MKYELDILAEHAVKSSKWRWLPGMMTINGRRIAQGEIIDADELPELADPATIGALMGLLRHLYNDMGMFVEPDNIKANRWSVYRCTSQGDYRVGYGNSEAAALVAALKAAS